MGRSDLTPLTRVDILILTASALLGAVLALATDREYVVTHGQNFSAVNPHRQLPVRLQLHRHTMIRVAHDGSAALTVLGIGLTLVAFRPRSDDGRPRRKGPGDVAAALTTALALAFAVRWAFEAVIRPPTPPLAPNGAFPLGVYLNLYGYWVEARPQITAAVTGAWSVLALLGFWRRDAGRSDRLGRRLGAAWFALWGVQGVVYVLAWY